MHRRTPARCVWTALLLFGLLAPALLAGQTLSQALDEQVRQARRVAPEIGVHVVDLRRDETTYAHAADVRRIVASNTKLFTTAAALDRLGPGFAFETEVRRRGLVRGNVLEGDLAVLGGGDPTLSGRDHFGDSYGAFREWARALRAMGIARVTGDLYLVDAVFDRTFVHPDWPRDQLAKWYEAPVAGLSFNDNCVLVKVHPGPRAGAPARVEIVPPLPLFTVENRARTTDRSAEHSIHIGRGAGATITVSGAIYRRRSSSVDSCVAVRDPLAYFGAALRAALGEEGITLDGTVKPTERLPGIGWFRVHTHRTGLMQVVDVIHRNSQNFYAESLLKVLGARLCNDGSWAGGLKAVREFLTGIGLTPEAYRMADGSGMSRNNRFTPRQITHLLGHMYDYRWAGQREYVRSLPYTGFWERTSWSKRLATPPYRQNVFAKTGTLRAVSAFSGYAKARSGTLYAFSILLNGSGQDWRAKRAENAIVRALIDHG